MSTILVTGALGHIGSSLLREAPRLFPGDTVRILDNLATLRYCSLFGLPSEGSYDFREGDMHGPELLEALDGVSAVVHLAGITDAAGTAGQRDAVFHANFQGTATVAEACAERGIAFLLASTTSVYGTQSEVVDESCPESDLKPQSPYAESKLAAERHLEKLGREQGLRWLVCRFGTIFGVSPGMRFHTAVNKFVWQASLGRPITTRSDRTWTCATRSKPSRSWCAGSTSGTKSSTWSPATPPCARSPRSSAPACPT